MIGPSNPNADDARHLQPSDNTPVDKEPKELPPDIIGMIASYLPEEEQGAVLDPLLHQFTKQTTDRNAAKKIAEKEAYKTKDFSQELRQALKKQGDDFVFPEELKKKIKDVTSLDLSYLGEKFSAKAFKEIITYCRS